MRVIVAVPFRDGGCKFRAAAWQLVSQHLSTGPWPVIPVDDGGTIFSRAASLSQAFTTTDADVVIACDADILIPIARLATAAALAANAPGLVQPFDEWVWCDQTETLHICRGRPWTQARGAMRCTLAPHMPLVGACNVVSRHTWELSGGWLPAHRGWSLEDISFAHQCAVLAGPLRRLAGPAVHLYHPKRGAYASEETIAAGQALAYRIAAASEPDALRDVLTELGAPAWTPSQ